MMRNNAWLIPVLSLCWSVMIEVLLNPEILTAASLPLQIPLQGEKSVEICTGGQCRGIAQYITLLYQSLVGLAAVCAVLAITWGGVQWLISRGESGKIQEARKLIWNALMGLALALTSYLILATLNPAFVSFTPITIGRIQKISLSLELSKLGDRGRLSVSRGAVPPFPFPASIPAIGSGAKESKFSHLKFISAPPPKYKNARDRKKVSYSTLARDIISRVEEYNTSFADGESFAHDVPTLCHELTHEINLKMSNDNSREALYIGGNKALAVVMSEHVKTKDAVEFFPPVFLYPNFSYELQMFGVTDNPSLKERANYSALSILDELIANTLDAECSIDVIKAGKKDEGIKAGTVDPVHNINVGEPVVMIPYVLATALAIEKHDPSYLAGHPEYKDTVQYLIERGVKALTTARKFDSSSHPHKFGGTRDPALMLAIDRLINDSDPKTEALRDLARRWYNTPVSPNWTKEWLGF